MVPSLLRDSERRKEKVQSGDTIYERRVETSGEVELVQIDHYLLVKLWDKAVGTRDYDKKQWSELSNQVLDANRQLREEEKERGEDRGMVDS